MSELITQSEYARSRGVSKQAVSKLIKQGKITLIEGKIDPAFADLKLRENVSPARSKTAAGMNAAAGDLGSVSPAKPPPSDTGRFFKARADREEAGAARELLELRKLQGELLDRDQVERGLFEASRMLRDQVLTVPKRTAGDLAGMTNASEIEQKLTAELRRALEEFSKMATQAIGETSN